MNIYEQNNKTYFDELKQLVRTSKKWALQINAKGKKRLLARGHIPKYAHLKSWIDETVPMLNNQFYTIMTKVYWILHGVRNWNDTLVRCKNCKKPFKGKNVRNVYSGYFEFCSVKCANSYDGTKQKVKNTNNSRYGGHPSACTDIQAKAKKTRLKRYGDENWNNAGRAVETRRKRFNGHYAPADYTEKCRQTKIANGHTDNWNNCKKAAMTRRENNDGCYESENSKLKRWKTCINRYGVEYAFQSDHIKDNAKRTCLEKYGVEYYNQTEEFRRLSKQTCLERYGAEHPSQCPDIMRKSRRRYAFDGMQFDSSAELEFFVYMRDCGYTVVRDPGIAFGYVFNGKAHIYHPDFLIVSPYGECHIIEIKGDQFFRPDGTMYCPYREKNWTDEQYAERCGLEEAKHQCMISNNVMILKFNSEYMKYIRFQINEKYGKDYFKQFKNK